MNRVVVANSQNHPIVMSRNCEIILIDAQGRERARQRVPYGARLLTEDGAQVTRGHEAGRMGPLHPADHHRARGQASNSSTWSRT